MKLRIGTLNCQNNADNRDIRNNNAFILAEHVNDMKYDILGTQELTIRFTNKISKYLNDYFVYGKFQYGRGLLGTRLPLLKDYNQGNQIITHYESNKSSTYTMPWIPNKFSDIKKAIKKGSMTKRMLTVVETYIDNKKVYILNTHLDYYITSVQQRQLNFLYNKIIKYLKDGFVVMMGDFNLDLDDDIFTEFINKLNNVGISRVPMNDKTNAEKYRQTSAIDHIFIPSSWTIVDFGIVEGLEDVTDHKAVYVDVSFEG